MAHGDASGFQPNATPDTLPAWTEREFGDVPGFTWANRAAFYGQIYNRRFPDNANGQTWLRKLMENKKPAFGYTVLARILAKTQHNLVITTNFDNLVHDALVALSCPRAFIAHSPEDARFLANHDRKPRIIKLHGDIDRETYNGDSLISDLAAPWHEPLRHLLGAYTPIFLGYAGSDPGLMNFLNQQYHASPARPRPIWAYRVDTGSLNKAPNPMEDPPGRRCTDYCGKFMETQQAWWLPTPGFDELMILLGHALDYAHAGREIREAAEEGAKTYQASLTDALKVARNHDGSRWCPWLDEMTRRAEQVLLGEVKRRRWSEWGEYIHASVNPHEQIERCEEATRELPEDPRTYAKLACAFAAVNPSDSRINDLFAQAKSLISRKYSVGCVEDLYIRNGEAHCWWRQGKAHQAAETFAEMVRLRQELLGPEHSDTLASRTHLANALADDGKYIEAEAEHRAVLGIRQRVLGPEHPDTLSSRNDLANALQYQGKHAEAETEHRVRIEIEQRVLGPEHPGTMTSRNNLATALGQQGKYGEAEAECRAVLEIRQRVLGADHPDTLGGRNNLANALRLQHKYMEAEAEHRAVVDIQQRVSGFEHPAVFTAYYNLSLCLEAQGKKAEALTSARKAFEGWRKVLGESHPHTLRAQKVVQRLEQNAMKPAAP